MNVETQTSDSFARSRPPKKCTNISFRLELAFQWCGRLDSFVVAGNQAHEATCRTSATQLTAVLYGFGICWNHGFCTTFCGRWGSFCPSSCPVRSAWSARSLPMLAMCWLLGDLEWRLVPLGDADIMSITCHWRLTGRVKQGVPWPSQSCDRICLECLSDLTTASPLTINKGRV
jgi:hypothetical protein